MKFPEFWKRPIVVVDVETTGVGPDAELIDIGAIIVRPSLHFTASGRFSQRIMPEHPERVEASAKRINGFDAEIWEGNSMDSVDGIRAFVDWLAGQIELPGAIFASWNVTFDWAHIVAAMHEADIEPDKVFDYHRIDLFTLAASTLGVGVGSENIRIGSDGVRAALGLKMEPRPHRAAVGARLEAEVLIKILEAIR